MRYYLLLLPLLFTGCTDMVYMKNPQTGQMAECGPYWIGTATSIKLDSISRMETQCINDYKEQGYVRNPGPR